mgnify:CR=1 FL=1
MPGLGELQAGDDFFTGALVGGRGEGDARYLGETLVQQAEL